MKKIKITTVFVCAALFTNAQVGLNLDNYTFAQLPEITAQEDSVFGKNEAVCLHYSRAIEIRPNAVGQIEIYELVHNAFKVYKREFLDAFNQEPIRANNLSSVIACGGKLTVADGKTQLISKKDIDLKIEDGDTTLMLKFPNANVGDVVEFFSIVRKQDISATGRWSPVVGEVAVKEMNFTIIAPQYLGFEVFGYNGLTVTADTVIDKKTRYYVVSAKNLPPVPNEPMAFVATFLPLVKYVLAYNYSQGDRKMNTIESITGKLYSNFNEFDKKTLNAIKKFNSQIKVNKKLPPLEQAQQIENYVKTHFSFYPYNAPQLGDLNFVLQNRVMNDGGCAKLLYNLFALNNIRTELIFTADKTEERFDTKNEFVSQLDEYLLYLPDFEQYTTPYFNARIGYPTASSTGTEGYVFHKANLKNGATFSYEPCKIPLLSADKSIDEINAKISFDLSENQINTKLTRSFSGYCAFMQTRLAFLDEKDYEQNGINRFFDLYAGLGVESINTKNIKTENAKPADILQKPLIISVDLADYTDLQSKGDTLTFTVGNYIGKQGAIDLTQKRTLPVERNYLVTYRRNITVDIPQGYKCLNINDLEQVIYDTENAATAQAAFTVKAHQSGNQIIITCEEYYKRAVYPAAQSKGVLSVAAAAAEFNNVKLKFVK